MSHRFKPGDLVREKATRKHGLVRSINKTEINVCWQDVNCGGWDTNPDDVTFICHIPAAKVIDDKLSSSIKELEDIQMHRMRRLLGSLME